MSAVCCQVEVSGRADYSSRGDLPSVVRRSVWSRNLVNEEALAHGGLLRQKNHPINGREVPEGEQRYKSTPLPSALDGVGGQRHDPAALPRETDPELLYRRLGRPKERSKRMRKISPPPGFDPRTVRPVASRYTDYAIPAHIYNCIPETNHVSEVYSVAATCSYNLWHM